LNLLNKRTSGDLVNNMNVNRLYVVGGKQRARTINVDEWNQYEQAVAVAVDVESGSIIQTCEYVTPEQFRPDTPNPSILFKSGSLKNSKLYACTQTEIVIYSLPDMQIENHISLPCFNDVHHVVPTIRNTLLVAVTGLDLVLELSGNGEILQEWSAISENTWDRFSRDVDYRKVETTKPHLSHPNFVFQVGDDVWVTRFEQKDAVCLTSPEKGIDIGVERPHDGYVFDDKVYFTTVDSHVVVASLTTLEVVQVIDLRELTNTDLVMGWCRGLQVIDNEHIIVGFSRIRPTKLHANLLWLKGQIGERQYAEYQPTHVAMYNISTGKLCWEIDLEEYGLNSVFSVHAVE